MVIRPYVGNNFDSQESEYCSNKSRHRRAIKGLFIVIKG